MLSNDSSHHSSLLNSIDAATISSLYLVHRCAEQNLTMASQIENFLGSNSALSRDKRAIAEIEEAVSERIQNLSDLAFGSVSDRSLIADNAEPFVSMKELCERLFPKTTPEYTESQFDAAETLATMLN